MTRLEIVWNLFFLAVDLLALRRLLRLPSLRTAGAWAGILLLVQTLFAVVAGRDPFEIIRLGAWVVFVHAPLIAFAFTIRTRGASAAVGAVLVATAAYAFLVEPYRIEVTRETIRSAKIRREIRIGVLSDIQTDRIGDHERDALRLLMRERLDLVLLPGDYLQPGFHQASAPLVRDFRALLREENLSAPLGVYAARGDVERNGWQSIFADLPVRAMERTETIHLADLSLTHLAYDFRRGSRARVESPGDSFHIVFAHRPDFALGRIGADLLVAGHTHGGQVRLPWIGPLLTFSAVPRAWADKTTRFPDGRTLVVSRGVGMERGLAPRLRFLCPPEIVVITLLPL